MANWHSNHINHPNYYWDDLRMSLSTGRGGASGPPTYEAFVNYVYAWSFSASASNYLYGEVQMPHDWAEGTNIRPHLHWAPSSTNTGNVQWDLQYSWTNINGTIGTSTGDTVEDAADGTANKHQVFGFSEIDGTGMKLSSILLIRIARFGAAVGDTYADKAWGLSFDIHYLRKGNQPGSVAEYSN